MRQLSLLILIMMITAITLNAEKIRQQQFELFFAPYYVSSTSLDFKKDAQLVLNERTGWSLGLGFNFTDHASAEVMFSSSSGKYVVNSLRDDGTSYEYIQEADYSALLVGMSYNILEGAFTPYVSGDFGISFVDTGIADGGGYPSCWYDPWYGSVCGTYETTKTTTQFSLGGSTGVRYDFDNKLFVKGGIGVNVTYFNSKNLPYFLTGQLFVGSRF